MRCCSNLSNQRLGEGGPMASIKDGFQLRAIPMLVSRNCALFLVLALTAGCATKPPTQKQQVATFLSQSPRIISIEVDREIPPPVIRTTGTDRRKGAARGGATGAAASIGVGCVSSLSGG